LRKRIVQLTEQDDDDFALDIHLLAHSLIVFDFVVRPQGQPKCRSLVHCLSLVAFSTSRREQGRLLCLLVERGFVSPFMFTSHFGESWPLSLTLLIFFLLIRRFSKLVADEELRKTFVESAVRFLRLHSFDGLDLDWEYPAFREGSSTQDKDGYAKLIQVRFRLYCLI
jgi:hypothetical protein